VEKLIETIKGYDPYLAGLCLGEYRGNQSDFGELIDALFSEIENEEARKGLVRIADAQTIDRLIGLLKDEDDDVRKSAADALGKIGSDRAVELLIPLLKDKDWVTLYPSEMKINHARLPLQIYHFKFLHFLMDRRKTSS